MRDYTGKLGENPIYTNNLTEGDTVLLEDGRYATLADNKKGNIRDVHVQSPYHSTGSAYAFNIKYYIDKATGTPYPITHTKKQLEHKKLEKKLFGG